MAEVAADPAKERAYQEWKAKKAAPVAAPDTAGDMAKAVADEKAARGPIEAALQAEVAPAQDAARKSAQDLATAADKKTELLPLPQNAAKHLDPKQLNDAAQVFMTMGALFGMLTRQPMTAALGNMTAAMKGVQEGDAEQYDRAMKEFNNNFDKAMKSNGAMLAETKRALENKDLALSARLEEVRIIEAKYGGPLRGVAGDFKTQMEMLRAREKAHSEAVKTKVSMDRLDESMRHNRVMEAAANTRIAQAASAGGPHNWTPAQELKIQMLADQYRAGDPRALTGLGFGKAAQPLREAVLDRAAADAQTAGQSGSDLLATKAGFAATQASMRSYQTYADRLEALGGKIDKDINVLFDKAKEGVGPSGVPAFDKWIQMGRRGTGDPAVVAFDVALQTVKNEYGRSMSGPASNAQLHVSAMDHADKLINDAQNVEQLKAAVTTMRQDIKNGTDQAKESIAAMKARITDGTKPAAGAAQSAGALTPAEQAELAALKAKHGRQ